MKTVQLISITPEELQKLIITAVQPYLEEIKQNFVPREPEQFLTRKATAKLLHVNLSTLHNWGKNKKLCAVGIGNRVFYRRSDIDKALIDLHR